MSKNLKRASNDCEDGTPAKRSSDWDDTTATVVESNDSNRMKVYVRVRPLSDSEELKSSKKTIDVIDSQLLVYDPIELNEYNTTDDQYLYHGKKYREIGRRPNKNLQFVFDRVFNEDVENIQIYELSTKKLVESLLNGYNCAVFAYGATGSGKTHTMLGSSDDPGVIFFTTMDLFRQLEDKSEEEKLELSISYFEIYNELVFDLLDPTSGKALAVREDSRRGVVVQNLSVHQPKDAQHLLEMLEYGNRNRTQHPTDANAESSRSHAVFQISLKKQDFSSAQELSIQVSKMSLIDLAGSERASTAYKTNRSKNLQREGGNINKSLLALGNCINALATNDPKKKTFVSYRGSKLTLLLRDSLSGNCHTAMIATISPSNAHIEETHNTLVYANRAKGIQLNLKKNNFSVSLQPRNYTLLMETMNRKNCDLTEENQKLKAENERLRAKIDTVPKNRILIKSDSNDMLNAVKNSLDLLFEERLDLRRELMECVSSLKKVDMRLLFRKYDTERYKLMATNDDYDSSSKSDPLQGLYNQKLHFSSQKNSLENRVKENENRIKKIETDLKETSGPEDWLINRFFTDEDMRAEFKDRVFAEKHSLEISKEILSRLESSEELMTESVRLNRHSYHSLNGMGRLSEELETAFNSLLRKVEGKKTVNWKDNISSPKLSKRKEVENLFSLPIYCAIPKTPVANTSRALVSVHDITPCTINMALTPERDSPLTLKNIQKLSLSSQSNKSSKVAVVSAQGFGSSSKENKLNDTFTIEENRTQPSPSPARRNHWRSPIDNYRNDRQFNHFNRNGNGSGYNSRSPYQSSYYSNQYRNSNHNSYRNRSNNHSNRRFNGNSTTKSSYPPFRF